MKKLTFLLTYVYKSKETSNSSPLRVKNVRDAFNFFFNAIDVLHELPNPDVVEVKLVLMHGGKPSDIIVGYPSYDCKVWDYDCYSYLPTPMLY